MPTATIDGLEVIYATRGAGPALLMLAPGGFDATMEKWTTAGVWKGMRPLDSLSSEFTVIVYDRRETGASGGRVERLSWSLFAEQAKGLLDHLGVARAFVLGGCMGCSVAVAFAAGFPEATHALILHWPVGGYRWKLNGADRFARHLRFAREHGLAGVVKRAHEGKSFWQDPEAGPWASSIVRDQGFAEEFQNQDVDRYLGIVAASARSVWPLSCSGRYVATRAATVMRLRSRLERPGRSQMSGYTSVSVSSMSRGTTWRTSSRADDTGAGLLMTPPCGHARRESRFSRT